MADITECHWTSNVGLKYAQIRRKATKLKPFLFLAEGLLVQAQIYIMALLKKSLA